MKLKLFTIPNILTLLNLACGSAAIIEVLVNQNFVAAFVLIVVAATFDLLDGLTARLLGQYSELGAELDSLSDVVSFGVAPTVVMYTLFELCEKSIDNPLWAQWGAYTSILVVCFSALRLARFNIDPSQQDSFYGLPTPAVALFCLSLGLLVQLGELVLTAEMVALLSVVMAVLLVAPFRVIALKFKSLVWRENRARYMFLLLAAVAIPLFRLFALPAILVIYIVVSWVVNAFEKLNEKRDNIDA